VWNRSYINANLGIVRETPGSNTLVGTTFADTLIPGSGNDTLLGGSGSDTYIYASADGNDVIRDVGSSANTDTLLLSDVNLLGVSLSRPDGSNDLLVTINATGKVITVKD